MSNKKEQQIELRPTTIVSKVEPILEGEPKHGDPVSVEGDITPITRQKVEKVDAGEWEAMSVSQLHEQLLTMENRLLYVRQIGHDEMTTQLIRGINLLRGLIHLKTPDELKLI